MSLSAEIKDMEGALKEARVELDAVLKAANVDRSTWTRWKNGKVKYARYDTISRVKAAAESALANAPAP